MSHLALEKLFKKLGNGSPSLSEQQFSRVSHAVCRVRSQTVSGCEHELPLTLQMAQNRTQLLVLQQQGLHKYHKLIAGDNGRVNAWETIERQSQFRRSQIAKRITLPPIRPSSAWTQRSRSRATSLACPSTARTLINAEQRQLADERRIEHVKHKERVKQKLL